RHTRQTVSDTNVLASQLMKITSRHAAHSSRGAAGAKSTLGAIRTTAIISASKRMIALAAIGRTTTFILLQKKPAVDSCFSMKIAFILLGLPFISMEHR